MLQKVNKVFVSKEGWVSMSQRDVLSNPVNIGTVIVQQWNHANSEFNTIGGTGCDGDIRIGLVTGHSTVTLPDGTVQQVNVIDWCQPIQDTRISSFTHKNYVSPTEDQIGLDYSSTVIQIGHRYVVRIQRLDIHEHPGIMTYSYEWIANSTNVSDMIDYFVKRINKDDRNGVTATSGGSTLIMLAQPKDDSEGLRPVNLFSQVKIDAFTHKTIPHGIIANAPIQLDVERTRIDGNPGNGYWKVVRDRENVALGYRGITYRENAVYPYIAPDPNTVVNGTYDTFVVEYNNIYRSPDNQYLKDTPLAVEIYVDQNTATQSSLSSLMTAFTTATTTSATIHASGSNL